MENCRVYAMMTRQFANEEEKKNGSFQRNNENDRRSMADARAARRADRRGAQSLPGVSGGVMCVLFGIYQPMMALLSHPGKAFRQYYRLFIPVLIGLRHWVW